MFHVPSTTDPFLRQPIEQLGVSRQCPLGTEVFRRTNQSVTKMFLPDSIDHDPSCQRVFSIDQPLCQAQAVAGSLCAQGWEHGRNIGRDFFARLVIFPTMQHEGIAWFSALSTDHGARDGLLNRFFLTQE